MGELAIRPGRTSDVDVIVEFNIRLARETEAMTLDRALVTAGTRAAVADEHKGRYFLAEVGGRVVGQLMLTHEWSDWRNGDIWWIQSVYVDAEYRGRGVFSAIYRHVKAEAKKAGAIGMRLYIERENGSARKTYERLGMGVKHYDVMEVMF